MPSFEQQVVNNQIIVAVDVSPAPGGPTLSVAALLDTGAQVTAISPKVVQGLQLVPVAPLGLTVASGEPVNTVQYRARIDIPIAYTATHPPGTQRFLMGNQLFVAGLPYQPRGYDVILGMDFIGIFHITIYRNRIILSN